MNWYLLIKKDDHNNVDTFQVLDYDKKIKYYGSKSIRDIKVDYSDWDEDDIINIIKSNDYSIKINDEHTIEKILNTKFDSIHEKNINEVFIKLKLEEYLL